MRSVGNLIQYGGVIIKGGNLDIDSTGEDNMKKPQEKMAICKCLRPPVGAGCEAWSRPSQAF